MERSQHLRVESHGSTVDVVAPAAATADLPSGLAPGARVRREPPDGVPPHARIRVHVARDDGHWRIVRDGAEAWVGPAPDGPRRLCSEVHLAIAAHAPDTVFVHAGAVSWRGRAVVVPGRSLSGKTTIVRALTALGAGYLSDEYAVLGTDGRLHPYAKPLTVRTTTGPIRVTADARGEVGTDGMAVAAVLHTAFHPTASWEPDEATGAPIVIPLVDNAVAARLAPLRVLECTTAVARNGAVAWTGPRGDAADTARRILERLDALIDRRRARRG